MANCKYLSYRTKWTDGGKVQPKNENTWVSELHSKWNSHSWWVNAPHFKVRCFARQVLRPFKVDFQLDIREFYCNWTFDPTWFRCKILCFDAQPISWLDSTYDLRVLAVRRHDGQLYVATDPFEAEDFAPTSRFRQGSSGIRNGRLFATNYSDDYAGQHSYFNTNFWSSSAAFKFG